MELIVIVALLALTVIFFRDFKSFIYTLGIIEIFLRILAFIKNNIGFKEVSKIIGKYIPESIINVIEKYSTGILQTILVWLFLISMICFLIYLIKYFFKGK